MPKPWAPRQRKHKVIARSKPRADPKDAIDSNAVELIPAERAELLSQKRELIEKLESEKGVPVTGKKAKRLEKYLEGKLKKDENRVLLERAARSTVDTRLWQSSARLGQGKGGETKRERMARALRERREGIDRDGDNEEVLFEKRVVREKVEESDEDAEEVEVSGVVQPVSSLVVAGAGLKRPLEVDDAGKPVLKKRKRRGGIESKVSLVREPELVEEPEWEGFSSASEMDTDADSEAEGGDDIDSSEQSDLGDDLDSKSNSEDDSEESEDGEGSSESESEEDEDEAGVKKERSSVFKAWANQQRNEAMGFEPQSNFAMATETQKIEGFKPRAPEEDPLPQELLPTQNNDRKAQFVTVTRTLEIQEARMNLPVVGEEQKIMEAIHNNDLVVIYGATGSGKTTQVPQFLFEAGYGSSKDTPGMIGVTQPRRVAATSMAKRVGDEMGDHGQKVAYQIRFDGTVGPETAIKFMTDGVLLREVSQDILLKKYSAIVIDEAHERSVNTDILVGMLSRVVKLRKEESLTNKDIKPLKLVIMSATLRITDFTENENLFAIPPPVIQAEGRQYPVTIHYARKTQHDYIEEAFRKISRGHKKLPPGGFLVFLTGQNEITHLSKRLKEAFGRGFTATEPQVRVSGKELPIEAEDVDFGDSVDVNDQNDDYDEDEEEIDINTTNEDEEFKIEDEDEETGPAKMHVLPLYSLLSGREQNRVFDPPPDGSRLVILATNVAETSITIPGIRYVFDAGRSKERKYDQVTGVQNFEVGWISKASANQRAGRAGRTGPGHCYRLYSSAVYERDFEEYAKPEILRMAIEGVVLQLKAMNLEKVINFPFPTPPDRDSLRNSERVLKYLSAITPAGKITPMGATMSIFPLSPRHSRILLVGHLHNCLPYTIVMVAALSAADVFIPENQVMPAASAPKEEGEYFTNADRIAEEARTTIRRDFNKVQKNFCFLDDKSDAIKLLQVVGEFAHEPTEEWCQKHYVRFKVLQEIQRLRTQITALLKTHIAAFAGLKFQDKLPPPTVKQVKALKQMVAAGFIDHIAMRADLSPTPPELGRKPTRAMDVKYITLFPSHATMQEEDKSVYIHPASPLAHLSPSECPKYVIYSYLQRAAPTVEGKVPKARMHALTDISGEHIAGLAKGTPLVDYGKPIKEVTKAKGAAADTRECWVVPFLRAEGGVGMGWPLPARKVTQRKMPGKGGWEVI